MSDTVDQFDRDLSLLKFNERVLAQAQNSSVPLLERVRFLSIYSSNMDEYFMKRVGHHQRLVERGVLKPSSGGLTPLQVLEQSRKFVLRLNDRRDYCYLKILKELEAHKIHLLKWKDLRNKEKAFLKEYFKSKVFPVLTPLAVDPSHPFPFVSNLTESLGIRLRPPRKKSTLFARIKIPDVLPQWIRVDDSKGEYRFIRLIDLVRHELSGLFPEMVIESVMGFRFTRSADVDSSDESDDKMDLVEEQLRKRRMADVVRLEIEGDFDQWVLDLLLEELELEKEDVYHNPVELDFRKLSEIANLPIPELHHIPWIPRVPKRLESDIDIFKAIQDGDLLVHHPYESFTSSVQKFIRSAVEDKHVLAVKVTLYRTEDDSPIIPLLIRAAELGKQVVCVVELTARFDEAKNLRWGETLEQAGVHVVYGVVGLKTHSKQTLVVRREGNDFRFYAHVGTGNYNASTARLYTDFSLFTCNPKVTTELIEVFNYLTGLSLKRSYKNLLVAPINMRERFVNLIREEIKFAKKGKRARIIAKMNSLEDDEICRELYSASENGVEIDLIVRGFCCLKPNVKGSSSKIRVRSVVGRFLEHSRIFYFGSGKTNPAEGCFLIGSADWMNRNLSKRVETIVPVSRKEHREYLWNYFQLLLEDKKLSWILKSNGDYEKPEFHTDANKSGCQEKMMDVRSLS